jgi:hypothetical protein
MVARADETGEILRGAVDGTAGIAAVQQVTNGATRDGDSTPQPQRRHPSSPTTTILRPSLPPPTQLPSFSPFVRPSYIPLPSPSTAPLSNIFTSSSGLLSPQTSITTESTGGGGSEGKPTPPIGSTSRNRYFPNRIVRYPTSSLDGSRRGGSITSGASNGLKRSASSRATPSSSAAGAPLSSAPSDECEDGGERSHTFQPLNAEALRRLGPGQEPRVWGEEGEDEGEGEGFMNDDEEDDEGRSQEEVEEAEDERDFERSGSLREETARGTSRDDRTSRVETRSGVEEAEEYDVRRQRRHVEGEADSSTSITGSSEQRPMLLTTRFEHQVTDHGEILVLTGRDGQLEKCEDEVRFFFFPYFLCFSDAICAAQPIHAPGAIQAFGVLIVLDVEDDGTMAVQQVSEVRSLAFPLFFLPVLLAPSCSPRPLTHSLHRTRASSLDSLLDTSSTSNPSPTSSTMTRLTHWTTPSTLSTIETVIRRARRDRSSSACLARVCLGREATTLKVSRHLSGLATPPFIARTGLSSRNASCLNSNSKRTTSCVSFLSHFFFPCFSPFATSLLSPILPSSSSSPSLEC